MPGGSKGPETQTTTQDQQVAPYVQEAQQNLLGWGQQMLEPWLSQTPQFANAGFTPDQITAMNNSYDMATRELGTTGPSPFTNGQLNPGLQTTAQTAATPWASTSTTGPAALGTAQSASAAQVNPNGIAQFMSPYNQQVIDPAVAELRRQHGATSANIAAQSAAAGSFGGTREALRQAENDRALNDQVASLTGNLLNQGYGQAAGLAQGNANLGQQAALQNASLGTSTSLQNAAAQNAMGQFNTGQQNAMGQFNAQMQGQLGQFNAGQQNALAESNANRILNAYNVEGQLGTADLQRDVLANSNLAQSGGQQQAQAQRNLDTPWQMLDRLRQITPGATGGTTTTTQPVNNPSFAQQALPWAALGASALGSMGSAATAGGIGASLASIFPFAFLSDKDDKKDIKKLGNDPDSGLPIYSYNYKDDPASAPKRVGPMAQDIEKLAPVGAVKEIGGHKVVNGPWATTASPPRRSIRRPEEIPMDYVEPRLPWVMAK